MTTEDLLKQGIAALNAGRKTEARRLLVQVVQQDEYNEMGWLWLSGAVDTDEGRCICLENVLAINPGNEAAQRGIKVLRNRSSGISVVVTYMTSEFAVTNKRVLFKMGFIRRRSLDRMLAKVEAIGINQSVLGRLLGYGTVVITGTGGVRQPFKNVVNPLELRRQVQKQISA